MKIIVTFCLFFSGLSFSFSQTITGHITCEVLDIDPTLSIQGSSVLDSESKDNSLHFSSILEIKGPSNCWYSVIVSKTAIADVNATNSITPSKEGVLDTDGKVRINIDTTLISTKNTASDIKSLMITTNYD